MLITGAEIEGSGPLDVRLSVGRVAEIGPHLSRQAGEPIVDADGGALLPGLHDHHLHLFALAAADRSVPCGPPQVRGRHGLAEALGRAPLHRGWIRGVGYCESVAGNLDRDALDHLTPDRPVRIQHRSGALWIVNSAGVSALGLDSSVERQGIERAADGRVTGRLFRLDAWLRERLGGTAPPSLASTSQKLLRFGVTGVTDATPCNGSCELDAFVESVEGGELRQQLLLMGSLELPESRHRNVVRGAVKLMLDESALPSFDELWASIAGVHRQRRAVAVHCVTRAELVLVAAAFAAAGGMPGDRIEHASVAPPEVVAMLADIEVAVVTQPGFIRERGDAYAENVEARDRPWLYRGRGFLEAGVPLGGGTDAPFGDADPWLAMRSAVERRSRRGLRLGMGEELSPERALALFTSPAESPGAPPRRIEVGAGADLCLLDRPWSAARRELSSDFVAAVFRGGAALWQRGQSGDVP